MSKKRKAHSHPSSHHSRCQAHVEKGREFELCYSSHKKKINDMIQMDTIQEDLIEIGLNGDYPCDRVRD